jgi:nicotinamidase-related amidase
MEPRRSALLVIDMQNYFVKPGHQGEVPMARKIVPNINRLAAALRGRAGVWIRNGTSGTRQSWSTYHDGLMTRNGCAGATRRWTKVTTASNSGTRTTSERKTRV